MSNDSDEKNEFQQAMDGVTPLKHERVTPVKKKPRPVKLKLPVDDSRDDSFADMNIETGDELSYQRPGIQNRLFADL